MFKREPLLILGLVASAIIGVLTDPVAAETAAPLLVGILGRFLVSSPATVQAMREAEAERRARDRDRAKAEAAAAQSWQGPAHQRPNGN